MQKAVAIHALGIVVMFILFAFVGIVVFLAWLKGTGNQATQAGCSGKLVSYCTEWFSKNWDCSNKPEWTSPDPGICASILQHKLPSECVGTPCDECVNLCKDLLKIPR